MKNPNATLQLTHRDHQNLPTQLHGRPSPFHPEATAEPELGDFRSSENVVTTIELSNICAVKAEHDDRWNHPSSGTFNKMHAAPTVAVIPPEDILPMNHQEKIGGAPKVFFINRSAACALTSVCCGFCCDYRRGVIWSDVALIGVIFFFLVVQSGLDDQVDMLYLDDSVSSRINEIYDEYLGKIKIFGYITVMTSFASSISAVLFSIWIPAFQIIWLLTVLIASIFIFRNMYTELNDIYSTTTSQLELTTAAPILVGMTFCVIAFLYPHVAYVYEVHRGILTRETYPREKRGCCC